MSFPPGVPLRMGAPVFATTSMPQATMMVQMQPVPVTQVMMRPVVQQQSFMPTLQARPVPAHVVAQSAQLIQRNQLTAVAQPTVVPPVATHIQPEVEDTSDPAITVFVGNITDRASDTLIRQILMKCGSVFTWKRVQGASGKLQAFGFCEYRDPESALRAIHILHDYKLGDKKLLVKVDAKTQQLVDEWKKRKGYKEGDSDSFELSGVEEANTGLAGLMQEYANELAASKEEQEEEEKNDDILSHNRECPTVRESLNVEENLKELELEEEEKDYISKEIRSFRETQKIQDEKQKQLREDKEKAKLREKERERQREKEREEREKERKERERSRHRDRSRDRSRHRTRSPARRSPSRRSPSRRTPSRRSPLRRSEHRRISPYRKRSRSVEKRRSVRRSPVRSRSPVGRRRRSPSGSPISLRHIEASNDEETDAHERRRIERKIREKEAAYQERLRTFEMRERRKKREIEKQDEREIQQRKEMEREAKRLREFLADYDDERSDSKYYTGSALAKRRREREHEIETDQRDRKKEQEEIDILRKRLVEENHPDPDAAIAKAVRGTEDIWEPLIQPDTPPSNNNKTNVQNGDDSSSSSDEESGSDENEENDSGSSSDGSTDKKALIKQEKEGIQKLQMVPSLQPVNSSPNIANPLSNNHDNKSLPESQPLVKMEFHSSRASTASPSQKNEKVITDKKVEAHDDYEKVNGAASTSIKHSHKSHATSSFGNSSKRKKLTVSDVFNQDEDEDELPKKRKLVPLQYTEEENKVVKTAEEERKHAEEKRRMVRALIERIPTQKDDLFDYNLDWSMVDNVLMEKRIQPWITKKIIEYIGEEEPTLVEFICSKIMTKSSPEKILEDISMVLDDEAEVFVVKMWRLLIYETEAKKEGLTK